VANQNKIMENCIFCKIVKGEIPCVKIWEDENYLAFLDVNPISQGHTLLIPKIHIDYIFDIEDDKYCELLLKAKNLAKILKLKLNPKRIGMVAEGFGVSHLHIHLIPINKMSEMDSINKKPSKIEELKKVADIILSN